MNTTQTAWSLIGFEGPDYVRIVGGRTKYENVMFNDNGRQQKVLLAYLDTTGGNLHQVNRYVDPDTLLEIVA